MCISMYMSAGVHGGQKGQSDPLKLELQVLVSHLPWAPGSQTLVLS